MSTSGKRKPTPALTPRSGAVKSSIRRHIPPNRLDRDIRKGIIESDLANEFFSHVTNAAREIQQQASYNLVPSGRPTGPRVRSRKPLKEGVHLCPSEWSELITDERLRRHWEAYLLDYDVSGTPRPDYERKSLRGEEKSRIEGNIFYWMERYLWFENPKADPTSDDRVIPLILWPAQRKYVKFLIDGYQDGKERIVNKGRELGATWLAISIIYYLWSTQKRFRARLGCFDEASVDNTTTDSMFGKFRYILSTQPEWLRPELHERKHSKHLQVHHPTNGSIITGGSASIRFGRGSRQSIVLLDEWAHYPIENQDKIKLSLQSVSRSQWKISTPNGRGDDFHTSWSLSSPDNKFSMLWQSDPRRTEKWYAGLLRRNGGELTLDQREQEHGGNFAAVSGVRILHADRGKIEYDDDKIKPNALKHLPIVGAMDFGSGPSLTVVGFAYVESTDDPEKPIIYLDTVFTFSRVPVDEIASAIRDRLAHYNCLSAHIVGDPAGIQVDSAQESWESRLRSYRVPISCLDPQYNLDYMITDSINDIQLAIDENRFFCHSTRAIEALETIESWQWDIPTGVPIEKVNKSQIKPKKDRWSHTGDMLRYLVAYIVRMLSNSKSSSVRVTKSAQAYVGSAVEVSNTYDNILRSNLHGNPSGQQSIEEYSMWEMLGGDDNLLVM